MLTKSKSSERDSNMISKSLQIPEQNSNSSPTYIVTESTPKTSQNNIAIAYNEGEGRILCSQQEDLPLLNNNLIELIIQRGIRKYEQMEPNKKVILRWSTLNEGENVPLQDVVKFEYECVRLIKSSLYGETYLIKKKVEENHDDK